jgi:hypothetical protein
MFLNQASGKQRMWIGALAFAVLLPLILELGDVRLLWRLSKSGVVVTGEVTSLNPEPKDRRAFSNFRYTYAGVEHSGTLQGASSYRVGGSVQVTVDRQNPGTYVEGVASEEFSRAALESIAGAVWLSLAAALFFRVPTSRSERQELAG